jgi:hypothetical protein
MMGLSVQKFYKKYIFIFHWLDDKTPNFFFLIVFLSRLTLDKRKKPDSTDIKNAIKYNPLNQEAQTAVIL